MNLSLRQRLAALPPVAWVLALTFLCLVPFVNKAYHIDDTLFIRAAEQIRNHPLDFFGCSMNWFGTTSPMIDVFENPPLACYYIAVVGLIGGWAEPVLHLGLLLPALAAAWGIFRLSSRYTTQPLVSSSIAVLAPVFVISGTTVMCDMMLLALWVWSIELFERGLDETRPAWFVASGLLIGLAFLTKFGGLALLPLLLVYALCKQRRIGWWMVTPIPALLFLVAYEWLTHRLFGKGQLFAAAHYSSNLAAVVRGSMLEQQIIGLEFLGGCFLPVLLFTPSLWPRARLLLSALLLAPLLLLPLLLGSYKRLFWPDSGGFDWLIFLQSCIFLAGGVQILAVAVADFWERRDASALLLLLWVLGILVFAAALNWTINGRSFLPIVPAVGILVARRLERYSEKAGTVWRSWVPTAAIPLSMAISMFLAMQDSSLANAGRAAARQMVSSYPAKGRTVWFQGHWGFQHYMQHSGAIALDREVSNARSGDIMVVPSEAPNIFDVPIDRVRLVEVLEFTPNKRCSTMNWGAGAGFYAAVSQPFPFSLGSIDPESYYVFEFVRDWQAAAVSQGGAPQQGAVTQQFTREKRAKLAQRMLRRNPNNAEAHLELARFYASRARGSEAMPHFTKAIELNPNLADARLEMALLLKAQNQTREAISHLEAALRISPDHAVALQTLAWLLATSGDANVRNGAEAVRLAERADELAKHDSARVAATLAAAYAESGRYDLAITTTQRAIELERRAGQDARVAGNEVLLRLYQSQKPYHIGEPTSGQSGVASTGQGT